MIPIVLLSRFPLKAHIRPSTLSADKVFYFGILCCLLMVLLSSVTFLVLFYHCPHDKWRRGSMWKVATWKGGSRKVLLIIIIFVLIALFLATIPAIVETASDNSSDIIFRWAFLALLVILFCAQVSILLNKPTWTWKDYRIKKAVRAMDAAVASNAQPPPYSLHFRDKQVDHLSNAPPPYSGRTSNYNRQLPV